MCGACLSEARRLLSLSADDSPVTAAAKLLALRNPRKQALAVGRMQKAGLNVSWEEAARQAEFFRAQAQKRRREIEAEAAARNRAWLDDLEEFLAREIESRGLEWELHDWLRVGKGAYVVKLGVYPWGTTFLEGTLEEIRECVFEIIREVETARWRCPFCGLELGWREVTVWERCACGARFRQSTLRSAGGSVHENNAWEEIEERLLFSLTEGERFLYRTLLDAGVPVEDLFHGVAYLGKVFGWPAYAVRGEPRVKSREELMENPANALRIVLWEAGFSPRVCRISRRRVDWWDGSIDGVRVSVCPLHPGHHRPAVRVETEDVPGRREWSSLPDGESDELHEAWTEWLMENGDDAECIVTDSLPVDDYEWGEGFVWKSPSAQSWSGREWEEMLRRGLEAYRRKAESFLCAFRRSPEAPGA
ncbi:MAG: hypothetical protein ACPLRW_04635 [Moorellales bacterium]